MKSYKFNDLKKNLKKDFKDFRKIKVALLGDSATQFLNIAIRGMGFEYRYDLDIFEADFNQIERQVFDLSSELYAFKPDIVILFQSSHKLLSKYNKLVLNEKKNLSVQRMSLLGEIYHNITNNLSSKIIYYNYNEINDAVFGNYSNKIENSFIFQLRKLNFELMNFSFENDGFYICDLSSIQNKIGNEKFFDSSIYINTDMTLSIDALPTIAKNTLDIISSSYGSVKKCLVLDLDNTIWGGVIGDDGIENIQIGSLGIGKAFTEFQYWVKKLKERGIILAICSKNDESVAKEPFEKHPEMVLKLEDISVFVANWENKVANIQYIQKVLNIGFDSMVFIDDNPFERNIVKQNIPEICVPEIPEDPADYLTYLYNLNLFETVSFSNEDLNRTLQYQEEAKRVVFKNAFANEDEFLQSLNMISVISKFNSFNKPRVAQLSQRSNQFNLRTIRYSEDDIERIINDTKFHTFAFGLEDKFGDSGLICVVILKEENNSTWFIDTWFMSCRVLKRGMENFVLNTISDYSAKNGAEILKGEYIPTPKNKMVTDHYKNLGFKEDGGYWYLQLKDFKEKTCFIKSKWL